MPAEAVVDGLEELVVVGLGSEAANPKMGAEAIEEAMDRGFEALGLTPDLFGDAGLRFFVEPAPDALERRVFVRPSRGLSEEEPLLGREELGLRLFFVDEAARRIEEVALAASGGRNPDRFEVDRQPWSRPESASLRALLIAAQSSGGDDSRSGPANRNPVRSAPSLRRITEGATISA